MLYYVFETKCFHGHGLGGMQYLSIVFEQTDIPGDIFKYLHVFTFHVTFRTGIDSLIYVILLFAKDKKVRLFP
jgi:hypothetical protein